MYFAISLLSLAIYTSTGSIMNYKNWTKYTDGCIYRSLSLFRENDSKDQNIRNIWLSLVRSANKMYKLQNRNFSRMWKLKTISGTIDCCLGFSISEQIERITKEYRWKLKLQSKLRLNITFLEINLIRGYPRAVIEDVQILHNFQYRGTCKSFTGKMNIFTIFSKSSAGFSVFLHVVPSLKRKVKFMISVIDSFRVTYFMCKLDREYGSKSLLYNFMYHTVLYHKIHLKSFHVVLNKLLRVKLRFDRAYQTHRRVELYDGPDDHTKLIKQIGNSIILSTFQCYLKVYGGSIHNFTFGIYILSVNQKVLKNITINSSIAFNSNICNQRETQHCIIQFNTNDMYLNMSIINMTFDGPNFGDCAFGGLTYHGIKVKVKSNKFLTTLCDSYTQKPKYNSFDKIPMNYVTTEFYLLIIIYGYYPHNKNLEISIEISLTPCRGIIFLKNSRCKYIHHYHL